MKSHWPSAEQAVPVQLSPYPADSMSVHARARRIGIVTTWFERGAAYVSRQFLQALQGPHTVFIYARGGEFAGKGDPRWDGPHVTWDPGSNLLYPSALDRKTFLSWLQTNGIEAVLFNEQRWWPPVEWCGELGIVTGCYLDYYTPDTVPLFGLYDFLIANTRRHHSVFEWHPACHHIPWGTDVDLIRPGTLDLVNPPVVTFFHSSGMDPVRKGTDLVLRAFAHFADKARLVIHSQVRLRRALPSLSPLIRRLVNSGALELVTATIPLPGLYHRGDVYLYPSRLEGIGLSICEALAAGLVLVTTDNPPMNEFAAPDCSYLLPVKSFAARSDGYYWPECEPAVKSLESVIGRCIDHPDEVVARKHAARRWAESAWDWRRNSEILPGIFAEAQTRDDEPKRRARELVRRFEHPPIRRRHVWFQRFPGLYGKLRRLRWKLLTG